MNDIIECIEYINGMFRPIEIGCNYSGTVTRLELYGAFVELTDINQTVLVHVSELDYGFVKDPKKICKLNDSITIKW